MTTMHGMISGVAAVAMLSGGPGSAAAAEPVSAHGTTLEEIVVTAQKRSQVAQEIPVSLYAISGEDLEKQGITSIQDFGNMMAGVNIAASNPGAMRMTIRGSGDVSGSNQASSVNGFYLDETVMSYVPGYMPEFGLWDIERVEVLRGPQGTLFGEGSEGGTLRVITRKPDSTQFFGRYQAGFYSTVGGAEGYGALASMNAPLKKDVLAMTLAASYRKLPGWIDIPDLNKKDTNEAKVTDGRIALRYTPTEALVVDAFYLYHKADIFDFLATQPGVLNPKAEDPGYFGTGPVGALSPGHSRLDVGALTINYDFGPATLVSATAETKHTNEEQHDITAAAPIVFPPFLVPGALATQTYGVESRAFTQELRLVSNGDQKIDWTIGGYYKDEKRTVDEGYVFDVPAIDYVDQPLSQSIQKGSAWAVFGDVDFELTDKLSAQAGLRYFSDSKDFSVTQIVGSAFPLGFPPGGTVLVGNDSSTATSPKLGLTYKLTPETLLFVKYSEGFRAGGSNTTPLTNYPYASAAYGPDTLKAYEIGVKATVATVWYINLYAYHNDWTDLQLPFTTDDGVFHYVDNAGSATSNGAELEIGGRIGAGLRVGLTYSYTDSTIDHDVLDNLGRVVITGGSQLPLVSKNKIGFTASYVAQLTDSLQGSIDARYRWASGNFSDAGNTPAFYNEESSQLYLALGISGRWGALNLYGDNLLNRDDTIARFPPVGPPAYVFNNYLRPRNFGIEYRGNF